MPFTPFDLEYSQSVWEQRVDINLTESGVHPIRLDELLDGDAAKLAELMAVPRGECLCRGGRLLRSGPPPADRVRAGEGGAGGGVRSDREGAETVVTHEKVLEA